MDDFSEIFNKLSAEDIASLQAAADAMFGGQSGESGESESQARQENTGGFQISPALLEKLSYFMGAMNKKDSRSDLIYALKPHLSPARQKRADEAMQMMRMMELLPLLQQGMQDMGSGSE